MPYYIRQLRLCHQILSFCPDKLLLELQDLRALRLLILQLLNLVGNLALMIPARLHRTFRIPDLFQNAAIIFQILRKHVFLLAKFRHKHAQLIGDV